MKKRTIPDECLNCELIGKEYDIYGNESIDIYHCSCGHPTKRESNKPGTYCLKRKDEKELKMKK